MRKILDMKWLVVVLMILSPVQAFAWGGVVTGTIVRLDATKAGDLPFRVFLKDHPVLCAGGMAEGYLDDGDPNYKVNVSTLMLAKVTGSSVILHSDIGSYGRCKIGYIVLN